MDESMSNNPTYFYSALEGPRSFRLLRLAQDTNCLQCMSYTIEEFERGSGHCPSYTALSYAWGNVNTTASITLNGYHASITKNLHEALLHIRRIRPYSLLWVDALCIDQSNSNERGHQVSQMRAIYSDASNVISWLGPGAEGTDRLFVFLRSHHDSCTTKGGNDGNCGFIADRELADALQYLEERPYWHRIWVIQEIVVATSLEVMCGDESVMWSVFIKFWSLVCRDHFKKIPGMNRRLAPFGHSSAIIPLIAWRKTNIDLAHALELTGLSRATDERDKVYALLGLVDCGAGRHIVVDYTISACRIFLTATHAIMDDWNENDTDISKKLKLENLLSRINTESSSRQQLPKFRARSTASQIPECNTIAHLRQRVRFLLRYTARLKFVVPNDGGNCDGETCGSWAAMYKAATIQKYPKPKYQMFGSYGHANQDHAAVNSSVTSERQPKSRREASRTVRSNIRRPDRKKRPAIPDKVSDDAVQGWIQYYQQVNSLH
ncbi:hypothetical protein HBH56_053030 [Parastagonospora nodorum]|uniref:Heterokaryon incompatibility domain-containing protein n=2 Tax=Phaeosphaeria nodorum (strain SN15 / ATCC MYA-4574 / FGSC 10173) TaxID=321614 RepID=A0A7U2I3P8_PHANO|nr:hypothetical protein SNOG_05197 [Parastagonospora nodorum SN15]KAH3917152.1 hypothetical protein HBH56_053030 [Parastagonospora nodorum]EAT87588.1 hypothetical protein SNOG_05197 [Parastagonospora nodorum SN15]KAH3935580.1 hypothetical protein HBH54_038830 [Parastagonospora nodorum]KAH3997421.1 hypothetical protein HBI10_140570 [Parastagonospora nodorum]KAH4020929.1 hypothetical protein HBI13_108870 [Parastagonospora nodorum]